MSSHDVGMSACRDGTVKDICAAKSPRSEDAPDIRRTAPAFLCKTGSGPKCLLSGTVHFQVTTQTFKASLNWRFPFDAIVWLKNGKKIEAWAKLVCSDGDDGDDDDDDDDDGDDDVDEDVHDANENKHDDDNNDDVGEDVHNENDEHTMNFKMNLNMMMRRLMMRMRMRMMKMMMTLVIVVMVVVTKLGNHKEELINSKWQ